MASPFIKSIKLPISCNSGIPKPSHDPTNRNCIVISTYHQETGMTPGIYRYNIMTNESKIIYKYNNTFNPDGHGQFIDTSNNTLILYGGDDDTFKIFDLNTNQMKQINDTNI
eukprot:341209_1